MNRLVSLVLAATLGAAGLLPPSAQTPAQAQAVTVGGITLTHPVSRPNLPNRPAVAYVTIANDGTGPDRLIAVASPAFDSAEIHNSTMEDGVMKMAPVEGIDIAPGAMVELAPGGYHIMLFGAGRMFKPGDLLPLVLTFREAGEIAVDAEVQKLNPAQMGHGAGKGHMGHGKASGG